MMPSVNDFHRFLYFILSIRTLPESFALSGMLQRNSFVTGKDRNQHLPQYCGSMFGTFFYLFFFFFFFFFTSFSLGYFAAGISET